MIRYDLICDQGHGFDGWFRDPEAFDVQVAAGQVGCAVCGSSTVEKQLMAPQVGMKSNRKNSVSVQRMASAPADPRALMLLKMMREIRAEVEKNAENVGEKFAEEARRIHYGESEKRGIYGEATGDEAQALLDEGIEVLPLPRLPEDGH